MTKSLTIIFTVLVLSLPAVGVQGKNAAGRALRDGFALAGLDGKLVGPDDAGKWSFKFYEPLTDDRGIIKPDQSIQILASSTLEKIIEDSNNRTDKSYRIWGQLTKYRGKNYILPGNFLPVSETAPAKTTSQPAEQPQLKIDEPDDTFTIPKEVAAMLKPKRTVSFAKMKKVLKSGKDATISDRTGFISRQADSGKIIFELDALGRNVQQLSFRLLPCEGLQRAETRQARSLGRVRFKVAGIVTKYKGLDYLLLQRAEPQYNHGNFAR